MPPNKMSGNIYKSPHVNILLEPTLININNQLSPEAINKKKKQIIFSSYLQGLGKAVIRRLIFRKVA